MRISQHPTLRVSFDGVTLLEVAIGFVLARGDTTQHQLVASFGHTDDLSDNVPR